MNLQKTGVFIQNARKRMNLSQRMLGEKLSVTSQAVSKWERGLDCPDIEVLKEMATLFGCSITDILDGEMSTATTQCFMQPDEQPGEESQEETESLPERDLDISIDLSSAQLISPLLFGDNLEHTRACIYGGLSAEVLRNRKFAGESGRYGCAQEWYPIGRKTLFSLGTDVGYLSAGKPYTRHAEG